MLRLSNKKVNNKKTKDLANFARSFFHILYFKKYNVVKSFLGDMEMIQEILPSCIFVAIKDLVKKNLNEIRLRINSPIMVNVSGKLFYLTKFGVSEIESDSIICRKRDIDEILSRVSQNSLYSINDQLVKGYITYSGGIRIGVGGEFVYEGNKIKTIKNIQSLNIRIPHEVNGFSFRYFQYLCNKNTIYNTLVLSPAGAGKTTFIRDFAKQLLKEKRLNMLVVDEREEITGISNGESKFEGFDCDILSK